MDAGCATRATPQQVVDGLIGRSQDPSSGPAAPVGLHALLGDPTGQCFDSCGGAKVALPPGSSSSLWDERLEMASGMGEASAPGANSFQKGHKVILAMCAIVSRLASREEAWAPVSMAHLALLSVAGCSQGVEWAKKPLNGTTPPLAEARPLGGNSKPLSL